MYEKKKKKQFRLDNGLNATNFYIVQMFFIIISYKKYGPKFN